MAILALATLLMACPKKPPKTNPEDMTTKTTTVAPQPTEVTQPAVAAPVDKTPDPLSGDLQRVNAYVQEQGLLGDIFFDYDRAELKPEARERLAKNAQWLTANPQFLLTLEGHCDERGTNEYNLALGDRRASAARDYLQSLGVANTRVKTISYGEERPFCEGHDESCWSQNRRAHFMITGRANAG
jgi:peptidoglycan-associated lipoprotein